MRPALFICLFVSFFRLPAQIKVTYDRFKDETIAITDKQIIVTSSGKIGSFMFLKFDGKRMYPVDDLLVSFVFPKMFTDDPYLFVNSGDTSRMRFHSRFTESNATTFRISREDIDHVFVSDCRIGDYEFRFPQKTLKVFRAFVALVDSSSR